MVQVATMVHNIQQAMERPDPSSQPTEFVKWAVWWFTKTKGWTRADLGRAIGYKDGINLGNVISGRNGIATEKLVRMVELIELLEKNPKLPRPKATIGLDEPLLASLQSLQSKVPGVASGGSGPQKPAASHETLVDFMAGVRKELDRLADKVELRAATALPMVQPGIRLGAEKLRALTAFFETA